MIDFFRTIPNEAWFALLAAYVALVLAGVVAVEDMRREPASWLLIPFVLVVAAVASVLDAVTRQGRRH